MQPLANKSQIARDFWRKLFDENTIDMSNSDARNNAVNLFLDENKNTWKKADRRFFRLGFTKVCKERNFNPHSIGVKPVPQKTQSTTGALKMNITTDEKKGFSQFTAPPTKELKTEGQEAQQKNQEQINQATYYSAQNVAVIFDTLFNLINARFPECSKLTFEEKTSLGEAWRPIFDEYLTDRGGKWLIPITITAPIALTRFAQFSNARKEEELKNDLFPEGEPPEEDKPKRNKWGDIGKP